MNANNIVFRLTDGEEGYSAGTFYDNVVRAVFRCPEHLNQRHELLMRIFGHADHRNLSKLNGLFPGVFEKLQANYTRPEIVIDPSLERFLRVMPFLMSFMLEEHAEGLQKWCLGVDDE